MPLPAHWRLVAENETGESIPLGNLSVDYRLYKGDGSGGVDYAAEVADTNAADIADGAEEDITGTVDNTTDGNVGLVGNIGVDLSGGTAPNGDVLVWLEGSTDGGTSFERSPSPLGIVNFTGSAATKSTLIAI